MNLNFKEQMPKMKKWLSEEPQIHYCTSISIIANDELYGTTHFAELKQPYPTDLYQKILVLWRAYQRSEIMIDELSLPENQTESFALGTILETHVGFWNVRELNTKDINRMVSYFSEYQRIHIDKTYIDSEWGIYKGKHKLSFDSLKEVQGMLYRKPNGFVLFDEWNDFLYVNSNNSQMQLLNWSTGA